MKYLEVVAALVPLLLASAGGCSSSVSPSVSSGADYTTVRAMSGFYETYLQERNGQAPPDEQAFRKYIEDQPDRLKRYGLTVDKMFVSPRNGAPIQWVFGKVPSAGRAGMVIIAYETEPTDGERLVLATRGMSKTMNEADFRAVFPNAP